MVHITENTLEQYNVLYVNINRIFHNHKNEDMPPVLENWRNPAVISYFNVYYGTH